jgi:NADH dehydrogenase FAD-containing subunit
LKIVICTGSNYQANERTVEDIALVFSKTERARLLQKYSDEIDHAKSIIVVGGGATGAECVAEIKLKYDADKELALINSQEHLLTGFPARASNKAFNHFNRR